MVIAIASQKGGVGKTTTAISLAAGLARKGKKTLLIDIDSQANSSKVLIADYQTVDKNDTVYSTILERKPLPVQDTSVANLSIAPSHILLSNTDIEHACIVGTGVPQPMALICLSDTGKKKTKDELIKSFTESLNLINPSLEKFEKIEKMVIMKENWTIANNMITPSLKVKRNEIEKIHLPKYPAWYDKPGPVFWE